MTVARAADLLKVSKSTLWRWIAQGELPAYRFGHRRVLLKEQDLKRLITPARAAKEGITLQKERERLSRPLTKAEQTHALAAIEAAKKLRAQIVARRGGKPFPDSAELIREMRDERTRQLS
ncbi:MAG: helix-turn-helix domain-containing protein [Chloroflexi bacterium]|nr:helix-turn-helix domain-containing protein [Chloroflexota bacterium]